MSVSKEQMLELYRKMTLVRAMETTHGRLLQEGKIQLMRHFGTGQEAVSIGVTGPLRRPGVSS
jgi:TPP-dependent pyruvate/acetoin dehydrogenase alpha subunit